MDYREIDGTMPIALLLVVKEKELVDYIKKNVTFLFAFPMRGHVTSLNASVAAALLMYEIYRKRDTISVNRWMNILIVDGYNMIGAWPELQELKE